jgi:hypothetical protein
VHEVIKQVVNIGPFRVGFELLFMGRKLDVVLSVFVD